MKSIVIAVAASAFAVAGCGTCPPQSRAGHGGAEYERARVADTNESWQPRSTPVIVATPSDPTSREWTSAAPATAATPDANNTKVNARDRDGVLPTPVDQNSNDADVGRTTTIRKRILELNLSIDAQNVKVITQSGRVTLRGPVRSQSEKDTIDRIARDAAGDSGVDDLLEVVAAR